MKKHIAYILIVILSLTLIGCNSSSNDEKVVSGESTDLIMEKVKSMTIEEKINQMMIISIPYTMENDSVVDFTEVNEDVEEFLNKNQPGGVILFQGNMIDYEQTKKLISDIKSCSEDNKFFISVDEEGGLVHKIPNEDNTPDAADIGNTGDSNEAYKIGEYIGGELDTLGFNLDFAPVMDVNTNPDNPVIGVRSFSNDQKVVSEFANKFVEGLHSKGILATAKHFPGHGDTDSDSHVGLVTVNHPKERIYDVELYPFKEAVKSNIDMIMVGHIVVPALDDSELPASLSKVMVTDILRDEFGFNGVAITDALNMGAISENYTPEEAIKLSINAGCDIMLMPNVTINPGVDVSEYNALIENLVSYVENGEIDEERINEAVYRILTLKENIE